MRATIRSRPWAGLDVGSHSVKLVALQSGAAGARHWTAETPLPGDDGAEPTSDQIAEAIAVCFEDAGLSPRGVRGISMGIAGTDVIIKQIGLPLLADDEVGPALRYEARKHLPFDPAGMVIDFQIVGRYPSEKRLDILLAAVGQAHLDRHLAPLEALGVDADIVDATPLALANALAHDDDGAAPEPLLLLDLGHSASHLAISQRGEPFFARRLDFGGRTLSRAIAATTQVPIGEAEEWKIAIGSDRPGLRADWGSREMGAIHDCLRRDLVEELRRSLAFYRTVGTLAEPYRLRISGGSARIPGLPAQLSGMLGYPVELFRPAGDANGHVTGRELSPQFAQAYGLALRTA